MIATRRTFSLLTGATQCHSRRIHTSLMIQHDPQLLLPLGRGIATSLLQAALLSWLVHHLPEPRLAFARFVLRAPWPAWLPAQPP